jgi:hypothetical protein
VVVVAGAHRVARPATAEAARITMSCCCLSN